MPLELTHNMARKNKHQPTNKALAYLRVSTDRQDISMGLQEQRIRGYCVAMGLDLGHVLLEPDVSGKVLLANRTEGRKIAAMIKSEGVSHVIALKLDRLFRNAADALTTAEKWLDQDVSLHLVDMGGQSINTGSSAGKMFFTMLAGFAEFERNLISDRITAALGHKKSKGERLGCVPYGFRAEKNVRSDLGRTVSSAKLSPNPDEIGVITRIQTLRQSGLSLRAIATSLNTDGLRTRRGSEWVIQTVDNVLKANIDLHSMQS